jgi:hypothetical protein
MHSSNQIVILQMSTYIKLTPTSDFFYHSISMVLQISYLYAFMQYLFVFLISMHDLFCLHHLPHHMDRPNGQRNSINIFFGKFFFLPQHLSLYPSNILNIPILPLFNFNIFYYYLVFLIITVHPLKNYSVSIIVYWYVNFYRYTFHKCTGLSILRTKINTIPLHL